MAVRYAVLKTIQNPDTVPEAFLYHLQRALLLALQEQGTLSISEYGRAEEILSEKHRASASGIP